MFLNRERELSRPVCKGVVVFDALTSEELPLFGTGDTMFPIFFRGVGI
jgi:hypothetical protein